MLMGKTEIFLLFSFFLFVVAAVVTWREKKKHFKLHKNIKI